MSSPSPASAATAVVKVFVFFLDLEDPLHLITSAVENVTEDVATNAAQSLFSQCLETVVFENAPEAAPSAAFLNNDIYMFYGQSGVINYSVFNGTSWGPAQQVTGISIVGSPSAVTFNNEIYLFYQIAGGSSDLYYTKSSDGVNWSGGTQIDGNELTDSPSAVVFNGKIYVFYQASNGSGVIFNTVSSDGSTWASAIELPFAVMSSSPSATVNGSDLYLFFQNGGNGKELLYTMSSDGTNWTNGSGAANQCTQVPNVSMVASPSAVGVNGTIYAFYIGTGSQLNQLWHTDLINGVWTPPTQVAPLQMTASPSTVTFNGNLYYFFQGVGNSGVLWCAISDGTGIQNMYQLYEGADIMSCTPGSVVYNNQLYVFFHINPDSSPQLNYITSSDGVNWSSSQSVVSGAGLTDSPSAVVFNSKLYVFYQGKGNADTPWYSVYDGSSWSSSLNVPNVGMWYSPSAVVFNNQLYVFYRGSEDAANGQLWYVVSSDGTNFTQFNPTMGTEGSPCFLAQSPAAVVFNDKLYVFSGGADSAELQYITSTNGSSWSDLFGVGGDIGSSNVPQIAAWPAAAVLGDTLWVLYQSAADSKLGWASTTDGSNWTLSPAPPTNSASNPFACLLTLTQAEFDALDAVT